MKIAQVAPISFSIPPKDKVGGAEVLIQELCNGLSEKRHDITVFATKDSKIKAKLISFFPHGIGEKQLPSGREFFLLPLKHVLNSLSFIENSNFDIIHFHFVSLFDYITLGLIKSMKIKNYLITCHQPFPDKKLQNERWQLFETYKDLNYVVISNYQKNKSFNIIGKVSNGINIKLFIYNSKPDSYIIWIGRIGQYKGLLESIQVAKRLKKKFIFWGKTKQELELNYFNNQIKPLVDDKLIIHKGEANPHVKNKYLGNSKLFLFAPQWEEPFGLVMIESMATGTPVVAFARGSVPEVIKDGETGFIVNPSDDDIRGNWIIKKTGIEGLCEAVERIYNMPKDQYVQMRKNCRAHVEKNFTVERMVDEYEKVYQQILSK